MKNLIKKITAVTMAMTLIGVGSIISENVPNYNNDYAIVHAAAKKADKKNEKKQNKTIIDDIGQVIGRATEQATVYLKVDRELKNAIHSNSRNKQYR